MAAKLQMRGTLTQVRGFVNRIWGNVRDPTKPSFAAIPGCRKCVHSSVYDKNEEDNSHMTRVPEDAIEVDSQKPWVPHPKTGVFGPAEEKSWAGGDHPHSHEKSGESVLEQQAWFRPLEDVQKQPSN